MGEAPAHGFGALRLARADVDGSARGVGVEVGDMSTGDAGSNDQCNPAVLRVLPGLH